jgi:hypothetical protein
VATAIDYCGVRQGQINIMGNFPDYPEKFSMRLFLD